MIDLKKLTKDDMAIVKLGAAAHYKARNLPAATADYLFKRALRKQGQVAAGVARAPATKPTTKVATKPATKAAAKPATKAASEKPVAPKITKLSSALKKVLPAKA